jgi:hypothetical protein
MEKMKLLATLVCAFAVLVFANTARAQDDEAEVDWDEAIEFAEVTDTYVENNVEWVTYYDELQNVMWSQPADATPEAVKAYLSGDQETAKDLGLDCTVVWPVPEYLKISPTAGPPAVVHTYTSFNLVYDGPVFKRWEAVTWGAYSDVDNYVDGRLYNRTSYCSTYEGYVNDQTSGWIGADVDTCTGTSVFYYRSYHSSTVENWVYPNLTSTPVTGHAFYACGYDRSVALNLTVIEPEK